MTKKNVTVYVDADACPVKEEISETCKLYSVDIFFIASYAHVSNQSDERWIFVDSERESVDLYIVNHATSGDIVITQDHGLASLLTDRGIQVLSPRGEKFSESEMDHTLFKRYLSAKQRRAGSRVKGPRKMTDHDRRRFQEALKRILSINEGKR
ncbi:MAG TPA: YaiI/YqxD family protein [Bacillales bacterium]|nr:YaiI/YqxD family protein [Bacillales bacterium]